MTCFSWAASLAALLCIFSDARAAEILIDPQVPRAHRELLMADLRHLSALELTNPDPDLVRILETPKISGASVREWIEERIQYIVHQTAFESKGEGTIKGPVEVIHENFHYPDEDPGGPSAPASGKPENKGNAPKMMVKAAQLSSAIYIEGKRRKALLGFNFPGAGLIQVTSPRAGILLIGEGLFAGENGGPLFDAGSFKNFALRMGTLLHESRHSDGHGRTLAFAHDFCPKGHLLQNALTQSCDHAANGPYALQAAFLRTLARSCKDCSRDDATNLLKAAVQAQDRVVRWWPEAPVSGAAQKRVAAEQLVAGCDLLLEFLPLRRVCSDERALRRARIDLDTLRNSPLLRGADAADWDANPEFALPNQ